MQITVSAIHDFEGYRPENWRDSPARKLADDLASMHQKVLTAVATHIYDRTQEELKKAGIEYLELYRGMTMTRAQFPGDLEKVHVGFAKLQPLSSFSANLGVAHTFAFDNEDTTGSTGVMMVTRVPRAQIFSTPRTGVGCLSEYEFVVMGGRPVRTAYAATKLGEDIDLMWFRDHMAAKAGP